MRLLRIDTLSDNASCRLVDLIWGIYADSEGKDIQSQNRQNFSRINMVTTFAVPPFGRRALLRAPRCFKPASNSSIFASPALKHNGSKRFAHSFASIESRKNPNLTWSKQVSWPLPGAPSDSALGTSWGHHSVFERHFLCRHATVAPAVSEFQPTQTTSASFVSCAQSGLHTKTCYNSNLQGFGANHPWSVEVRNWICTGNRLLTLTCHHFCYWFLSLFFQSRSVNNFTTFNSESWLFWSMSLFSH